MRQLSFLEKKNPTLIVSAGGLGVGPVEDLIKALAKANARVNIIAMCGKNEDLKERLEKNYAAEQALKLLTLGYVNNVQDYMNAADLIVGKPGGLTTAEALACGLAFVIVNPIPGQEERNSAHLLENGAAIRCNNMTTIGYKVKKLLEDPVRLAELKLKALAMSKPNAAIKIAEELSPQPSVRPPREIMCNSTVPRSA
ncbi:MAG: glycosyltransferase [Candidatus Competibacteraceae bacterium]|nr:glycosyltransferase [Candidatus Competibacteraceae bacterium]